MKVGDVSVSCSDPYAALGCGGHWRVSLGLPPALQQVGVYPLDGPELQQFSMHTETGQPTGPGPDACTWGGGTLGKGTLEIIAIDASGVHFKLDLTAPFWDSNPSGEYVAARCP